MKLLKIFLLALLAVSFTASAGKLKTCSFKNIPLYGKVKVVDSNADIKVKVVDYSADLDVQKVDGFADSCGKWEFAVPLEDYNFTVQFDDYFPDITIRFVDYLPGIR